MRTPHPTRPRRDSPGLSRRRLLQRTSALAAVGLLAGGARDASAGTPATPPANVRVSHDDTPIHAEPSIAVNPAQPDNLLGAAQLFSVSGERVIGTYASFDAGQTWQDNGPLPFPPGANTGNDVTIAFDAAGHGFVAAMATSASQGGTSRTERTVTVWRTDDGGRSFAPPVAAVQHQFVDHPWLAIDPASGTLYLAWMSQEGKTAEFTRSTDGGATFDEPRVVATPPERVSIPVIAAGPDGAVYIAYEAVARGTERGRRRRADRGRRLGRRGRHVRRSARDRAGPEPAHADAERLPPDRIVAGDRPPRRGQPRLSPCAPRPTSWT